MWNVGFCVVGWLFDVCVFAPKVAFFVFNELGENWEIIAYSVIEFIVDKPQHVTCVSFQGGNRSALQSCCWETLTFVFNKRCPMCATCCGLMMVMRDTPLNYSKRRHMHFSDTLTELRLELGQQKNESHIFHSSYSKSQMTRPSETNKQQHNIFVWPCCLYGYFWLKLVFFTELSTLSVYSTCILH